MAGYKHLEIVSDFEKYVKDKKTSAKAYYRYLLTRLLRMFQYKNLPDTIPHEILDRYLFENGIACITSVEGELYVFYGNLGGPMDVYYRPTEFIISNPHIRKGGELFTANVPVFKSNLSEVGQPTGVLIRNDTEWQGLHPLIARYAYLMAENVLTLRTADVMLRIIALLTAKTDKERAASIEYLKSIEKGELGVIGESSFHEGVEMQSPPSNNGSYLTQFIEYQQYLKGSFYNEIGLAANYNMKREAIGKGESTLDTDALLPLCDNMLKTRKEDLAKVNEMFGTEIEVEFSSAWLENRIENLAALKSLTSNSPSPFSSSTLVGQPTETSSSSSTSSSSRGESFCEDGACTVIEGSTCVEEASTCGEKGSTCSEEETIDETCTKLVNDLSVDVELTEMLDELVNQPKEGGEIDDTSELSESTDDKEDTPDK